MEKWTFEGFGLDVGPTLDEGWHGHGFTHGNLFVWFVETTRWQNDEILQPTLKPTLQHLQQKVRLGHPKPRGCIDGKLVLHQA